MIFLINKKFWLLLLVFFLGFIFGAARLLISLPDNSDYNKLLGQKINFVGRIVAEPSVREKSTQLVAAPENGNSNLLLIAPSYTEYRYGDKIKVTGKLVAPENFETDSGKTFDYINYLAKDDVYYEMIFPKIELLESRWTFVGQLYRLKQGFLHHLAQTLPEPEASLLGGIAIGAKQSLDQETSDNFRTVGLSHVIVLSGYNITIVAESVLKLLKRLPLFYGSALGGLAIILFVLMTGATSTAIRAAIMALVALLGRLSGREYDSLRALIIAGFLMILWNPQILVYDLSFQLSFLATLGVIIGPPLLTPYLKWFPERFGLRDVLATTLAAQLLVLPWILYKMGQLSLVALPINLLVLPLVPLTMFLGFALGLIGFLSYSLSLPIAYLVYLPLWYFVKIAELGVSFPFASLNLAHFPLIITVSIYSFYIYWYYRRRSVPHLSSPHFSEGRP
jgi:competence protein ComEC